MSDPRVIINGPFDAAGNNLGRLTPLYLSNEAEARTETETNQKDIPGKDSDASIVNPLEASRDFSYNGETSGLYLMREGYGDTPKEAVRNYIFELESLVLPYQSSGYVLDDKENDIEYVAGAGTKSVMVEEVSWTYNEGDNIRLEWDVSLLQGEGVQESQNQLSRRRYISDQQNKVQSSPTDKLEFLGFTLSLGNPSKINAIRSVDIEAQQLLHNTDTPQVAAIDSGVKEEVRIDGLVTDQKADIGLPIDVNDWASKLNIQAHGVQSTVTESMTGRTFGGTLEDTSTTFESGRPRACEYSLTFKIGKNVLD
jgi:hypothetical protein